MHWICKSGFFSPAHTVENETIPSTSWQNSDNVTENMQEQTVNYTVWDFSTISVWIIIPVLCGLGLLGNALSVAIFSIRLKDASEVIETGSTLGIIGLTLSNFLFCLVTVSSTFVKESKLVYFQRTYSFYVQLYAEYFINLFIKVSIKCYTLYTSENHLHDLGRPVIAYKKD